MTNSIAHAIALPNNYSALRYPSFPALERTALLRFSNPAQVSVPASTGAYKFMATRQAAYPFWADNTVAATTSPYSVSFSFLDRDNRDLCSVNPAVVSWDVGTRTQTDEYPGIASGAGLAFADIPYPIIAVDEKCGPQPFVWVPSTNALYVVLATNQAVTFSSGDIVCSIEQWQSPGQTSSPVEFPCNVTTGSYGLTFTSPLPEPGWYRVRSFSCGTDLAPDLPDYVGPFTCAVFPGVNSYLVSSYLTTCPRITANLASFDPKFFFPAVFPGEFKNTTLPWYATRTNATAVLLTNTTQVVNKAGTFLGGRVSPNVTNPFTVLSPYISTLHPMEKVQLAAEHGFYTYVPPSTDLANFWDYTLNTSGGANNCPVYRLDNDALVNVFFLTDVVASSWSIVVDWHIEFRTCSTLFPIGISTMPVEQLHQAQIKLSSVGYFFANEWHMILKNIISSLGRSLMRNHPLGIAASALGKAFKSTARPRTSRTRRAPWPRTLSRGSIVFTKGSVRPPPTTNNIKTTTRSLPPASFLPKKKTRTRSRRPRRSN